MRRPTWICLIIIAAAINGIAPLTSSGEDPLAAQKATFFELKVRPILAAKCVQCHGVKKQEGKLRLDSLKSMLAGGENGPAVAPGQPVESLLVDAINYGDLEMPPTGKLDGKLIAILSEWIKMGAHWPDSKTNLIRTGVQGGFTAEEHAYWAFQPLPEAAVPAVHNRTASADWPTSPVDHFILHRLMQAELAPAPEAEARTLIRRLYLDLLGLPPSPTELDDALSQLGLAVGSPSSAKRGRIDEAAYRQLVDQLLESPHYGERWARHWLDIVRYADSDGYSADHYRPHAWQYRDYVVRSFNNDKPYDQFVREQLAGDELAPNDKDAVIATAFLRMGVYEFNQRDARSHWSLIMDETTDVVGEALLGVSIGCARCHDHKFDPILREDYYRLQAFFTPILWRDEAIATPEQHAQHDQRQAKWEALSEKVRKRIAEIDQPFIEAETKRAVELFPQEIQEIYRKPAEQRNSLEEQLAYLVHRQVLFAQTSLYKKAIKGKDGEERKALEKELAAFDKHKPTPLPTAMTVGDSEQPTSSTFIPDDRSQRDIAPDFLSILAKQPANISPSAKSPQSTGRRAALAQWITRPDHPLTTRVIANRIWQFHFGKGIVATPNEFGRMGQAPTHPKLLDFLASYLIDHDWKLKDLQRLIVCSSTYRQSAFHPQAEKFEAIDPGNKLIWRADIRRLDAEQVRDAMLTVSGELDRTIGGEGVLGDKPRRSLYVKRMRNTPDPILGVFDGASGFHSTSVRDVTTTPSQTLLMLNGDYVLKRAAAIADHVSDGAAKSDGERVDMACGLVLGRTPSPARRDQFVDFLRRQAKQTLANNAESEKQIKQQDSGPLPPRKTAAEKSIDARRQAMIDFCHVLLNSNEFLYVE